MSNVINLRPPATAVEVVQTQITPDVFGPHYIRVKDAEGRAEGTYPSFGPVSRQACERMVATWERSGALAPGWSAVIVPVAGVPSLLDGLVLS